MRRRIYEIIEVSNGADRLSSIYDAAMIFFILASLVPLAFKTDLLAFQIIDKVTVSVFILDYLLRLMTADFKFGEKSIKSFIKYPFSFYAIIDLISILPSVTMLNGGLKLLRLFRMVRAIRVFRVFKALRYSKSFKIIASVLKRSKEPLLAVCTLSVAYILIAALVIFNVEPDSFDTFFRCCLLGDCFINDYGVWRYIPSYNYRQNSDHDLFNIWHCHCCTPCWYNNSWIYE